MNSVRGIYKDSQFYNNPLSFQVKVVITLTNEDDAFNLEHINASRGPSYTPTMQPLLSFRKIIISQSFSLISQEERAI